MHYFKYEVKIDDLTIFQKRAPQTDDLLELIEQSKHPVIKKLEFDMSRPDLINRKIFVDSWCGIMSFDELNDKLHTTDMDTISKERFDWGSFGDDALYKFLASNSDPWNNGEKTRQIKINGVRNRFYLLDDTRCPVPGKSYKDLEPKQIEIIHNNYLRCWNAIADEKYNYQEAMKTKPGLRS